LNTRSASSPRIRKNKKKVQFEETQKSEKDKKKEEETELLLPAIKINKAAKKKTVVFNNDTEIWGELWKLFSEVYLKRKSSNKIM
jgi:hypothetical protein